MKRQILGDSNLIYFWFLSRIKRVVWIMTLVLYLGLDQPRPRLTRGWGCWVPGEPWSTQWCLVRSAVWCWLPAYVISSMHFYIPCLKRLFEWLQCNILNKWIWLHDRKLWNVIHYVIDCSVRVVWRAIAITGRSRVESIGMSFTSTRRKRLLWVQVCYALF